MCVHTGEDPEIYQIWIQNHTKQHDWPKGTQKKCPIRDSNDHKGATLSEPTCVSTLFPPIKHLTCVTTFLYVEIHFYKAGGPKSCHWPLVPSGLVARIPYSYCHSWKIVAEWCKDARILGFWRRRIQSRARDEAWLLRGLCNKILLKYKGGRESFWHRHQKGAERVSPCQC